MVFKNRKAYGSQSRRQGGKSVRRGKIEEKEAKRKRKPLSKDTKKFLGLFVFVAVPLPMTGAWTGSCIGSFLDFPVWKASLAVFFGNIVAGLILTTIAYFLPRQYADVFLYGFVVLAIAIAVTLYFSRSKRNERKRNAELEKYSNKSEYELAVLKKEADKDGKVLIKKSISTKTATNISSSAATKNETNRSLTRTTSYDSCQDKHNRDFDINGCVFSFEVV